MLSLPDEVSKFRKSRKITQKEFAEAIGVTLQIAQDYEYGKKRPAYEEIGNHFLIFWRLP